MKKFWPVNNHFHNVSDHFSCVKDTAMSRFQKTIGFHENRLVFVKLPTVNLGLHISFRLVSVVHWLKIPDFISFWVNRWEGFFYFQNEKVNPGHERVKGMTHTTRKQTFPHGLKPSVLRIFRQEYSSLTGSRQDCTDRGRLSGKGHLSRRSPVTAVILTALRESWRLVLSAVLPCEEGMLGSSYRQG